MFNDFDWSKIITDSIYTAMKNGETFTMVTMPDSVAMEYFRILNTLGLDVNIRPIGRKQNKVKLVIGW